METGLIPQDVADFLESEKVLQLVNLLIKYQNSYLEKGTEIKTISGIRELIEKAEMQENIDDYLIKRIKKDLEIADMPETAELEITIGDKVNE